MIYLFDKHKKLKGTVRARHTIALLYERERNGIYSVSAEIPVSLTDKRTVYNYHKKVKGSDFIGHYDREGRFQLHKIAAVDIENTSIFIKGIHLFFDEAKAGAIIRERRFRGREIIDGAREAFDPIGWSVVDFDTSDQKNYSFYNVSPLEARAILVETFGYEFDYWLDFDGKNLRNKQIAVKRKIGKETNKRYNYGHNVLSIKVEQDYSEIYTAVIGRGKGEDLDDSDGYGRRIEFTDVEWKRPSKPLDKPKGSRTLIDPTATQLFGYHDGNTVSPRTKVEIFSDIEDEAQLIQASYEWLMDNNVPKAVFSLNVPDGDGLDLGDSVHVIYRDIDLIKSTRVTKVIDDLVSGNRSVEFGDTAYFETDRRISGLKADLKRVGGSTSSRIARLKAEFDRRFDNEVQQWKDDFEQALIDAEAAVEVMRVTMTEEFEAAQKAFEDEFNQSVAEAKKHADETAEAKAKQVQDNLDSFEGEHEQLVGELQGRVVDIDGEIEEARAEVSGIIGSLSGVEGRVSATEASLTVMDDEISSVVGRVSDNEANISSVVQDVNSITSTVATLEGDVATQGSKIEQTEDTINSKVWLDDVANIGANLIPTSPNAWEDGSYWSSSGLNNSLKENIRLKKDLAVSTYRDVEYTFTCESRERSNVRAWMLVNYDTVTGNSTTIDIPFGQSRTIRTIGNRIVLTAYPKQGESVSISGFEHNPTTDIKIKLEQGGSATPLLSVLSHIEQKADEVSIKVSELGSIDGESLLTQSDISVRADRILLGSQEIGAETLSSIISVSPRSIDMITDNLNLTGNLNAKGQIESISMSAVKAEFADLFAARVRAGVVHADYVDGFAAKFESLYTLNANIERLVAQHVFTNEVKALSLTAVEANIGSIRSKILTSDVILSSHINSSNALIDKIFSSSARFERMMAKSGFVRTLNTVTIDTDQITIRRPDGGRLISNGVLENTFSIQFIQPRFEGNGVDWSANYYRTTNTSYTTAAAFSYLRGGRYLTVEGYCEMRSAVSGSANTTEGHIRILEYSSGNRSSFTTIESRGSNNGGNQFFRIRIDMGVPQYEQRNFYVQFRTLHSGNAAHFRINQAYYHG